MRTGKDGGIPGAAAWLPAVAGLFAALSLVALYLALVTWAQGFPHATELLWNDRYYVAAIASGFGLQVGLFVYVRRLLTLRDRASAGAGAAVGTGASTAAMLACCAHHVADALPIVGLSGAAIFLSDYRVPLMLLGIGVNAAGVSFMARLAVRERRRWKGESCPAPL